MIAGVAMTAPTAAGARQASIVVDANSGAIVHQSNADAPRFPASLTKVMTLYMLFEQIEAGRFTLNSRLRVSAEAARQPPTRLGVRAGDTVRVEDAILALVARSANDVAVVVAENIAGSEEEFAERMTRRARQLGMARTTFRNASGLPNGEQRTTARDMALLGRAIYERFPEYSRYFARRSFAYGRAHIRNHNRLLGRMQHVDGIKTGYTRASGFNILTSARAGGRHLVAVVMGGRSSGARDAQVASLVRRHFTQMATRRTDFSVAQRVRGRAAEPTVAARVPEPRPTRIAQAEDRTEPQAVIAERPRPQIVPVPPPIPIVTASAAQAPVALATPPAPPPEAGRREVSSQGVPQTANAGGPVLQWRTGPQPVAAPAGRESPPLTTAALPVRTAQPPVVPPPAVAQSGWVVQIAATNTESDAQRMLREAREALGRRLATATPVTERVQRGNATLYRARFAGFTDRSQAEAACQALKRNDYDCMAIRL